MNKAKKIVGVLFNMYNKTGGPYFVIEGIPIGYYFVTCIILSVILSKIL